MDEFDDDSTIPLQPVPQSAPKPLPRMWKADDDDETEEVRISRGSSPGAPPVNPPRAPSPSPERSKAPDPLPRGGSAKPRTRPSEDGPGERKVKLEETPLLDTYETRKRVRILFGVGIGTVVLIGLLLGLRMLGGGAEEEPLVDEGALVERAKADAGNRDEEEAKTLFTSARQVAVNGKVNDARVMLERLIKLYPKTAAARDAREAIDRPSRNLPMFLDGPTLLATPSETKAQEAPPREPPEPAVVAAAPAPAATGTGEAAVIRPPNPAEPARPSMLAPANPPGISVASQPAGRPVPAGFRARSDAGLDPSGWPRAIVSDRDGGTMVFIPGGTFNMGREDGEPQERPVHPVTLAPYYIDQHEVTVRQFSLYSRESGRRAEAGPPPSDKASADPQAALNFPVVNITAREARSFCEWAGKRLPTEAQWEFAARTIDGRLHPWGNTPPRWGRPRSARQVDFVMSFENDRSPYDVYDLAGNAWEWTGDYYDSKYFQQVAKGITNPTGPLTSRYRPAQVTVKGGSKSFHASWREGVKVDARLPYLGFRGVLVLPDATAPGAPAGAPSNPAGAAPSGNTTGPVPF